MRFSVLINKVMFRVVHLPVVRTASRFIYRSFCSKKSLELSLEAHQSITAKLPPHPKGHALWPDSNQPSWVPEQYDLSIIIPFYKTEQYAKDCIQSVLNQETTFRYELILVDDGSPDNCPAILDTYQHIPNVVVIHQPNRGLSGARNHGIQIARGKYIMFHDSDDLLYPGSIQALMSAATESHADIVDGSFQTMTLKGKPKKLYSHPEKLSCKGEGMFGYAWGKVFRRSLFQKICFPEGYWFEDTIISGLIFPLASVTKTIPNIVSMYRMNPKGISLSSKTNPKSIDTYYVTEEILAAHEELGMEENRLGFLLQLGPYIYGRTQNLSKHEIQAIFLMAADLAQKYDLTSNLEGANYYQQQLADALAHRRYKQWKWVCTLM